MVAHAGLKEAYHGRASGRVRAFALYGDTTGETDEYGLPVRYPWASDYRGRAMVVYGHTPVAEPEWVNNTICLDTGCVFGGGLTALRYPERELVSVPAEQDWYEPVRPLRRPDRARERDAPADRRSTIDDVAGRRAWLETAARRHGDGPGGERRRRAGGDEPVRGRPALAAATCRRRWRRRDLVARDGLPGAPRRGVRGVPRATGVTAVVCEEKHMGSRAVVLVCRDAAAAAAPVRRRRRQHRRGLHPHRPAVLRRPER